MDRPHHLKSLFFGGEEEEDDDEADEPPVILSKVGVALQAFGCINLVRCLVNKGGLDGSEDSLPELFLGRIDDLLGRILSGAAAKLTDPVQVSATNSTHAYRDILLRLMVPFLLLLSVWCRLFQDFLSVCTRLVAFNFVIITSNSKVLTSWNFSF